MYMQEDVKIVEWSTVKVKRRQYLNATAASRKAAAAAAASDG